MAKGKQTPRQKMINLMYLVFIAMMALNIDVEIIRSFFDTTESLKATRELTEGNNKGIFEETLKAKASAVPDTYEKPWAQYQVLRTKIDELVKEAEGIKKTLKKQAEFTDNIDVSENYAALNDNETTTNYFFVDGNEVQESKKAKTLVAKINEVNNYIKNTFGSDNAFQSLVSRSQKALSTADIKEIGKGKKTWTQKNFYHQPLIAALSKLEILQNDARNLQSDALALMLKEKVDAKIKFDRYDAIVKAPTDIVQGTQAEAEVYLATYTANTDNVIIKGATRGADGKGHVGLNTNSLGEHTFGGEIIVKMSDGSSQPYKYSHTYNVIAGQKEVQFETGGTITADKMNVLYRGLDNPISASILGVDNSKLSLSSSGGSSVRKVKNGHWVVKPRTGRRVKLTVSGTGPRGRQSKTIDFRIKEIPKPEGQIRQKNILTMPVSSVPKQRLSATLPDFDFLVTFTVTGFKARVPGRATTYVKGNSLRPLQGMVSGMKSGEGVYIFDIEATATGLGNQRLKRISPVLINVQ